MQLHSITGGRSTIRNPRTHHVVVTGNPPNVVLLATYDANPCLIIFLAPFRVQGHIIPLSTSPVHSSENTYSLKFAVANVKYQGLLFLSIVYLRDLRECYRNL
jgi:hypothetical protein